MTSLTLGGCDGSLYMYSRAAILEWLYVSIIKVIPKMAEQNDHDSWEIIQAGETKRLWLLIEEENEGGGVTGDTYSKRYALFWSVSAAHHKKKPLAGISRALLNAWRRRSESTSSTQTQNVQTDPPTNIHHWKFIRRWRNYTNVPNKKKLVLQTCNQTNKKRKSHSTQVHQERFCCPNQQFAVINSRLSANQKIKKIGSSLDCSMKEKRKMASSRMEQLFKKNDID